jgi:hypothetical protein
MQIRCPRCDETVPAEDINLDTQIAKCTGCDELFSIAQNIAPLVSTAGRRRHSKTPPPRPERITVREIANGIEIRRRWFTPVVVFLTLFCIAWDGFIVFWYWMMTVGPVAQSARSNIGVFPLIFPLFHVAIGIALTWLTLCLWVNTTRIRVTYDMLAIRHAPVWWPGNCEIPAAEITDLNIERKVFHGKYGREYERFKVSVTSARGTVRKLLTLTDRAQATYIEHEVERFLGLTGDDAQMPE